MLLTYARGHHSFIVVRIDTHTVALEVKGKLAVFDMLQFILVQVWPPPQPGIDYMGEPFASSHLKTTIKGKGFGKTKWFNLLINC